MPATVPCEGCCQNRQSHDVKSIVPDNLDPRRLRFRGQQGVVATLRKLLFHQPQPSGRAACPMVPRYADASQPDKGDERVESAPVCCTLLEREADLCGLVSAYGIGMVPGTPAPRKWKDVDVVERRLRLPLGEHHAVMHREPEDGPAVRLPRGQPAREGTRRQ